MSELTEAMREYLPDDFEDKVVDPDYGEETAAKNYGVPILQELGLQHADYEERIESGDRPDFIWSDKDGVNRVVGEFKKPWDGDRSPENPRFKIEQSIEEARVYNDQLKLKYILTFDGRYLFFSNEYADPPSEIEIDLIHLYHDAEDSDVERKASQLQSWITGMYEGEWNDEPSQRDISEDEIFSEFIDASRAALNEDLLPSIERRFGDYSDRWDEYEDNRDEIRARRQDLQDRYRSHIDWDRYREAIDRVSEDIRFDFEDFLRGSSSGDIDEDRWIEEVAEFRDELLGLRNELKELDSEYRHARNWYEKWNEWLLLTGKDYEGASNSDKEEIRETFQLQTLNVLYNRLLLIRTFEDIGIIGQVISDGFIKFFDEKVQLRQNKYIEPLVSASRQAEEVYSPLFRRDTPHDWYHYEEPVLKTVLRRFDNFNFRYINRDIFGTMYQRCLDEEKRKRLGAFYTPPTAIRFLLDYAGFTAEETNIKLSDEHMLDPAAGSGTFVLEAMHRVIDSLKDSGYDFNLDADLFSAIDLINEKLRGFDIDPFAVQLAQSNLLIRVLQERRGDNGGDAHLELPSFSIFETDSLLTAKGSGLADKDRFYRARENDAVNLEAIKAAKEDSYSWVVGNPPYVRSHNQEERISAEYEQLHETFGDEQSDIFLAFVEQGLEWLEEGGCLAFVISNTLLVTEGSEPAMKFILNNATIDLVADLTRCKIFGFDVNVFPILIVLTKKSGDENDELRKANETQVVKVFAKGGVDTNEWGYALDHAAADLIPWREAPDFDFENDFESEEYPDVVTEDTYEVYPVQQRRFTDDWSDWSNHLTLNFQITDELWDIVKQMENSGDCVKLKQLCKMDQSTRGGTPSRGEEPRYFRPYTSDTPSANANIPVIGGSNIEQFYLGDAPADIDEYVDLDAIESDPDTNVSSNKIDAFKRDKIAYRETAPELSFVVDAAGEQTKFYNKTAYFLVLNDDGGLTTFTEADSAVDPHYLCGLLNSNLLDFYYKAYYEQLSFRHAPAIRCRPSRLNHMPIRLPDDGERDLIAGYSRTLHDAKRQLKQKRHDRENLFEQFQEEGKTENLRNRVASVVESRSGFGIRTFNIERVGTNVELNSFHSVAFHDEETAADFAEFLERFGDKYIGGSSLREVEIPSDLDEFRDAYAEVDAEIEGLSAEIDNAQDDLNDAVYDLYEVGDNREAIEDYLDSFLTVIK